MGEGEMSIPYSSDLLVYWPLNGDLKDASGNSRDLATHDGGSPLFGSGRYNNGYALEYRKGIPERAWYDQSIPCTSDLTVSAWAYADSLDNAAMLWSLYSTYPIDLFFISNSGDNNGFYINTGDSYENPFTAVNGNSFSGTALKSYIGHWTHFTVVFQSGQSVKLYISGKHAGTSKSPVSIPDNLWHTVLGAYFDGQITDTRYHWNGRISDFAIYNRALSDVEVETLYESQGGGETV